MAAQNKGRDVLDRNVELFGEEVAKAAGIENARHADNLVVWQARKFAQGPDHRVERVGNADYKRVRRVCLDAFADRLHNLQVDAEKVIAAHSRLAGDTGGDDDDVCASNIGIVICAGYLGIKTFDRTALRQVERFSLWNAFNNVE